MKLHGKEKIFFRQSTHIYLKVSWNLGDEIFPKGVGVVTPKNFIFGFIKIFIWFEGGFLNFSSKELSLSKISFCDKYFVWIHPRLDFGLGGFSPSYVDSSQMFFISEKEFLKNLFELAYGIWSDIFPLSKIPSCHDMSGNPLPKAISHLCVKIYFKSSKLNSPMFLFPFISYQKYFLSFILNLSDLQRNHQIPFEFWFQTNSSD